MQKTPTLQSLKEKAQALSKRIDGKLARIAANIGHRNAAVIVGVLLAAFAGMLTPTHGLYAVEPCASFDALGNCDDAVTIAAQTQADATVASLAKEAVSKAADWLSEKAVGFLLIPFVFLAKLIFMAAGFFMEAMGSLLDRAIALTISSDMYRSVSAIKVGWTAVRDFSNMFFIFVLLYIAIQTILGMAGSNTKRWVAHLIIAAILINFSLFFTQVVVDSGNVLALGFWNKITVKVAGVDEKSAAATFMQGFRIQTEFASSNAPNSKLLLIYGGGAAISFVAGYVFLAGAIMMIIRSVWLMLLMIASPFAFLGFALPRGGSFASQWLGKLIGTTFMAPAFLFMLYIDMLIINGAELIRMSSADKENLADAFSGNPSHFGIIYNFVLMVILLLASLTVAQRVSGGVGSSAGKLALGAIGGGIAASAATGGVIYRNTVGRRAAKQLENKELHHTATLTGPAGSIEQMRGDAARRKIASLTRAANSTGDIRASGVGKMITSGLAKTGVDTGGPKSKTLAERTKVGGEHGSFAGARDNATSGGFLTREKAAGEKAVKAEAEKMFPDNPQAQKAYIESKLGKDWTNEGRVNNIDRNKKAREALDTNVRAQIVKDAEELHPNDVVAQQTYIKSKMYSEQVTERQHLKDAAGNLRYDAKGHPEYGNVQVTKNVWDTPAMKEQRLKLQTKVNTQQAQQAIQTSIDALKNPNFAALPPKRQLSLQRAARRWTKQQMANVQPSALAQMKEVYLTDPSLAIHMDPAKLRAIAGNQEIKSGTLAQIQTNIFKEAQARILVRRPGVLPVNPYDSIPSLRFLMNVRPDSPWYINAPGIAALKAQISAATPAGTPPWTP